MKKKFICITLAFTLNLSACGNIQEIMDSSLQGTAINMEQFEPEQLKTEQSETDASPENTGMETGASSYVIPLQNSVTDRNIVKAAAVKNSSFSGKVSGCYYGGGSRIIVSSDKLYLYDMKKGKNIASADISMEELCVQTYSDGYFIAGRENGGSIKGYILDKNFAVKNSISFQGLVKDDLIFQTAATAISQDGKKAVFGGLQGLYLYDISSKKIRTILNYSQNGRADNMQIVTIDSLDSTGDSSFVYAGTAVDASNGGNGFFVYGTVSTDKAKLTITKKAGYQADNAEVQKGGDLLIMPQSFDKNNGTLLMLDTASNTEKTLSFASRSEGKDGVFCSDHGKYVATAVLKKSSVKISIYDTASGKKIHTETVKNSNSTYFQRIPQILILDKSGRCVVVLGRGIDKAGTLIKTFDFKR